MQKLGQYLHIQYRRVYNEHALLNYPDDIIIKIKLYSASFAPPQFVITSVVRKNKKIRLPALPEYKQIDIGSAKRGW